MRLTTIRSSCRGSGSLRDDFPASSCCARIPCLGAPLALLACILASAACKAAARGSRGRLPVSPTGDPADDPRTVWPPLGMRNARAKRTGFTLVVGGTLRAQRTHAVM
ncbi:hypothetical protein B0H12DRAFT_1115937 [Mycena haematopus]|nr:hypothetical protein B0H12DRAFT_1115937 [Mycena haematopus]